MSSNANSLQVYRAQLMFHFPRHSSVPRDSNLGHSKYAYIRLH